MRQQFNVDGVTIVYTYDGPLVTQHEKGNTIIEVVRRDLTYEERLDWMKEVREVTARLLAQCGY